MRGCHSPGTGRITAPGSSRPQSIRIVQRKRRPTSNVELDDGVAREARRDRLEIRDFAGWTAAGHFRSSSFGQGAAGKILYSMRINGPVGPPMPRESGQMTRTTDKG